MPRKSKLTGMDAFLVRSAVASKGTSNPTLPEAILSLVEQFQRLADQFCRYNDASEPIVNKAEEADAFKASYERETPGARELHNFLTGEEAADSRRRASRQQDGGGKKAARTKTGANGGGA